MTEAGFNGLIFGKTVIPFGGGHLPAFLYACLWRRGNFGCRFAFVDTIGLHIKLTLHYERIQKTNSCFLFLIWPYTPYIGVRSK